MQVKAEDRAAMILYAVYQQVGGQVGVAVSLPDVALRASVQHHGPVYDDAVKILVEDMMALEEGERGADIPSGDHPYGTLFFKLTQKGKDMVEEARKGEGGAPEPG
ncbi:MAG: hypothetical protein H0T57_06350 [Rubrobacter sp.]|nr:hypothetical protein [Rubrobacter sp.]